MNPNKRPLDLAEELHARGENEAAFAIEALYWMVIESSAECLRLKGLQYADDPAPVRPQAH